MKKIFDWLREQIYGEETPEYDNFDKGLNRGLQIALRKVDEAEAKWEAECCEHKWNKEYGWYDTSCRHILEPHGYNFCPYCGKPIKISEVE